MIDFTEYVSDPRISGEERESVDRLVSAAVEAGGLLLGPDAGTFVFVPPGSAVLPLPPGVDNETAAVALILGRCSVDDCIAALAVVSGRLDKVRADAVAQRVADLEAELAQRAEVPVE